jgi:hypothetical protein
MDAKIILSVTNLMFSLNVRVSYTLNIFMMTYAKEENSVAFMKQNCYLRKALEMTAELFWCNPYLLVALLRFRLVKGHSNKIQNMHSCVEKFGVMLASGCGCPGGVIDLALSVWIWMEHSASLCFSETGHMDRGRK